MGTALGQLQPRVRAALGTRPSEVAGNALAPNFPQLGLPMYPQQASSQLGQGESSEVVKPCQRGRAGSQDCLEKLVRIWLENQITMHRLVVIALLKPEPTQKVKAWTLCSESCHPPGCRARGPTPENFKDRTF